jgi:DedD protein
MIQVGSFADIANAHLAQDKLKSKGFASILAPAETAKGTLYRVRAGPFKSKDAAVAAKPTVVGLGFAQANLVEP